MDVVQSQGLKCNGLHLWSDLVSKCFKTERNITQVQLSHLIRHLPDEFLDVFIVSEEVVAAVFVSGVLGRMLRAHFLKY